MAECTEERFDAANAMLCNRRIDDAADLAVSRLGDFADELFLGRNYDAGFAKARLETFDIFRRTMDILKPGKEHCPRRRGRHGARLAQIHERIEWNARAGI